MNLIWFSIFEKRFLKVYYLKRRNTQTWKQEIEHKLYKYRRSYWISHSHLRQNVTWNYKGFTTKKRLWNLLRLYPAVILSKPTLVITPVTVFVSKFICCLKRLLFVVSNLCSFQNPHSVIFLPLLLCSDPCSDQSVLWYGILPSSAPVGNFRWNWAEVAHYQCSCFSKKLNTAKLA